MIDRGAVEPAQYVYAKPQIRVQRIRFGQALAASGDRIIVGANDDNDSFTPSTNTDAPGSGVVYVLRRSGEDWVQEAYLKGSNIRSNQYLGTSVAIDGDVAVAGTWPEEGAGLYGTAHVFRRGVTGWYEEQRLKRSDAAPEDKFGQTVAVHGDVLATSSWRPGTGRVVHIFRRVAGTWTEEAVLQQAGRQIAASIILTDDRIIIADDHEPSAARGISTAPSTDASAVQAGAVYVYRKVDGGWTLEAYIKASNSDAYDHFGYSIAFDGEVLVVGAMGEDSGDGNPQDNSAQYAGAAYVFRRQGTTWREEAYLKSTAPQQYDRFSESVAVRRDMIAVGASERGGLTLPARTGSVHLFRRIGKTWARVTTLRASNGENGDDFGRTVALFAHGLAAGAVGEDAQSAPDDNLASGNGAVYIFR